MWSHSVGRPYNNNPTLLRYGCTRYSPKCLSILMKLVGTFFLIIITIACANSPTPQLYPYILLFLAILVYIPSLLWSFSAAPQLSSELNFIMQELDRFYNRAIKLANNLVSPGRSSPQTPQRWLLLLFAFTLLVSQVWRSIVTATENKNLAILFKRTLLFLATRGHQSNVIWRYDIRHFLF